MEQRDKQSELTDGKTHWGEPSKDNFRLCIGPGALGKARYGRLGVGREDSGIPAKCSLLVLGSGSYCLAGWSRPQFSILGTASRGGCEVE